MDITTQEVVKELIEMMNELVNLGMVIAIPMATLRLMASGLQTYFGDDQAVRRAIKQVTVGTFIVFGAKGFMTVIEGFARLLQLFENVGG